MIAGNGTFPFIFLEAAKAAGIPVVVVAHEGETDPVVATHGFPVRWIRLGQVGAIFETFHKSGVRQAAFVGGIKKPKLFDLRPDWKGMMILGRLARYHDDEALRALASEFEKEGITIVPSTFLLPSLAVTEGVLTKRSPTESEREDIRVGVEVAKIIGPADIGQCVVVREKVVVAVEAVEGTDETIRRAGRVAGKGTVVVKRAKPGQDLRFDLPSVGPETIRVMQEAGATVLAVEAGKTLLFDRDQTVSLADAAEIAVVGIP
ncbi:MAG: UDP-2,3-diacylglucosamine diphosphatase LpxI [Nitrospirae bacterium]|nr:UDP-2,3-diacylglucosamine diphosphatase LpxI [Nitrospirota bacterium]